MGAFQPIHGRRPNLPQCLSCTKVYSLQKQCARRILFPQFCAPPPRSLMFEILEPPLVLEKVLMKYLIP